MNKWKGNVGQIIPHNSKPPHAYIRTHTHNEEEENKYIKLNKMP